jgi:hypothetical protein
VKWHWDAEEPPKKIFLILLKGRVYRGLCFLEVLESMPRTAVMIGRMLLELPGGRDVLFKLREEDR